MNVNFELYRIFYTVANYGNITKASEELLISQPAISKAIKNLEEQLGGQLFIRTKRGVILTEEGKEFYNYIIEVASGKKVCSEIAGFHDMAIFKQGVTL